MPRFFISPDQITNQRFHLAGSEAHHALHVLRKKVGDTIDLFDGKDRSYRGRIDSIQGDEIFGKLVETAPKTKSMPFELRLCPALIKAAKWDWLIEKACEIGVTRLTPLAAARSVVKIGRAEVQDKLERWQRIVLSASKQCGRSQVMIVEAPVEVPGILRQRHPQTLTLMPSEKESSLTVRQACEGYQGSEVEILVGPEGGWEPLELEQAARSGARSVRLGPTLLRSETAGLVACTLALAALGVY